MSWRAAGAAFLIGLALPSPLAATDARVQTITYSAGNVVPLTGHYGYQMMIALEPSERIENISIGDSVAWLVTPNKAANAVFIKPVEANAATNMTVQTDRRVYLFELRAARATRGGRTPGMIYKVDFRYPENAPQLAARAPAASGAYNSNYTLSGSRSLRPSRVFDDGRFTYLAFAPGAEIPGIFIVEKGKESLVNHATRGGYVVLDRVAERLVLRQGKERLKLRNKSYGKPIRIATATPPK